LARQSQGYESVQDALQRAGATAEAAEIHGSLCGVLCCAGGGATHLWLEDSLELAHTNSAQVLAARTALEHLQLDTWAALNSSGMEFMPLLPDDSVNIAQRVEALALWCQGFLYGINLSGARQVSAAADLGVEHFDEVVTDLVEISRAGLAPEDNPDEAGFAYAELVEFVRAAVQLLFEELAGFRSRLSSAPQLLH